MSHAHPRRPDASQNGASSQGFTRREVMQYLDASIKGAKASAAFACGGIIPIKTSEQSDSPSPPQTVPPADSPPSRDNQPGSPIHIFWSKDASAHPKDIVLPLNSQSINSNMERLLELVADCDPASFGRGDKNVLDPEYRRAGKIDSNQFATSFHPADYGLIDNVERLLLPTFNTSVENMLPFRKLSAELYKLNVYSGPAGMFRKHVDTPRSKSQIGSLVVCFPSSFQGGDLVVRHQGKDVEFKWDAQSGQAIQWAAFYSDCEHEIKTITDGHRITLTYNLYVTEPVVQPAIQGSLVDVQTLPLYNYLKGLLAHPKFMKAGGRLGIWCAHSYPHASEDVPLDELLPRGLKGSDLMFYAIFKSLGIDPKVLPIFMINRYPDVNSPKKDYSVFVAEGLMPCWIHDSGVDSHLPVASQLFQGCPGRIEHKGAIQWIATPQHEQLALAFLDIGNECSLETKYSYAAIIIDVPQFEKRQTV